MPPKKMELRRYFEEGGNRTAIKNPPVTRCPRKVFNREELLMELIAAEHSDEEPDDGELEGSGDDYNGESE